jgi:16S rRNA (adenine1518-N6/adenine1519-N6)-dimethyltransferase
MTSLLHRAQSFVSQHQADLSKDQFFCVDKYVFETMIEAAEISPADSVLEIGPGLGLLTEYLSSKAKHVLTIEIDTRFRSYLDTLPINVEVLYDDAYKLLTNNSSLLLDRTITKTVSNIPYSQAQNILHGYANSLYQGDIVWLAPLSLVDKVNNEPILGAYFKARCIAEIPKTAFLPQPNTQSAILYFQRIPDPLKTRRVDVYLRRYFYNNEHVKVKNMLREAIISAARDFKQKRVTKNEARQIVDSLSLSSEELEKQTSNIRPDLYFSITKRLELLLNMEENR